MFTEGKHPGIHKSSLTEFRSPTKFPSDHLSSFAGLTLNPYRFPVNRSTEGHSLLQVGDWTFVAEQREDGFVVTLSRESDKILVDGAARCD